MGKVLLFYKYISIEYPKRFVKWQKQLCHTLNLTGRILISEEGINGTVGGTHLNIERYKAVMKEQELFSDIQFKESPGNAECFSGLYVSHRDAIINLGLNTKNIQAKDRGVHLEPDAAHALMSTGSQNVVILDARNHYEWKIGRFINAITPPINNFRELPTFIEQNLEIFKDKQVIMFCTGGIRCENASAYLKSKKIAQEVYQIKGGIHTYVEKYPNGLFRGKNYVFDNRVALKVTDDILATCSLCNCPNDDYTNCLNARCNRHFISCPACIELFNNSCSLACKELILHNQVKKRNVFHKVDISFLNNNSNVNHE